MIVWPTETEAREHWLLKNSREPTEYEIFETQCMVAMHIVPNLSDHGVIKLLIQEIGDLNKRVAMLEEDR